MANPRCREAECPASLTQAVRGSLTARKRDEPGETARLVDAAEEPLRNP